ncbi:MAG: ubiquinone anaerobic biosynthesis protein UbiU [Pseudomonadota bacterium]
MTGAKTKTAKLDIAKLEIVCPAGTPAALHAAVEAGADSVYLGLRDETNARNFPGLNFDEAELYAAVAFAHGRGVKILLAINTYPRAGDMGPWQRALALAEDAGVDAVILADMGLADYAAQRHPGLRRHLSVQASAANPLSIAFYQRAFGVKRVVLPRVLTLAQIAAVTKAVAVETEVFVFGGLCVMAEGRCALSSYATGKSPNMNGVCSPASHVRYVEREGTLTSKLGTLTINRFASGEPAGYPTLCKGRFVARGRPSYLFEEPTSLNALDLLPDLLAAGVTAVKIEGRQRGRAYVARVIAAIREAVDAANSGAPLPALDLRAMTEGGQETAGVYRKGWR